MIRHEPPHGDIFVRYDGTETRVDIHRGEEGKGLTVNELTKLVGVLSHALVCRRNFMRRR